MDEQAVTQYDDLMAAEKGAEKGKTPTAKSKMMPMEVTILTREHEMNGIVYVSRETRFERRLTELLNGSERRFLAVKDVEVWHRNNPSSPRMYEFMQIHIDNILMIHPSAQAVAKATTYSKEEALRLDQFRQKFRTLGG